MRERAKDKVGPFGFNKQIKDETTTAKAKVETFKSG